MQPENPLSEICAFVVEKAPQEMPARRARLYRAVSTIAGSHVRAKALLEQAAECEQLDHDCRQLQLLFPNGNGGPAS